MDNPAFLSYSRADSAFGLQLAGDLKAAGCQVWLDQLDIAPGYRWDRAVEEALAKAPLLLVILSPSSATSVNVQDEVAFALDEGKLIIPIFYVNCQIPLRLRRLQYIDFRNNYDIGLKHLIEKLRKAEHNQTESSNSTKESKGKSNRTVTEPEDAKTTNSASAPSSFSAVPESVSPNDQFPSKPALFSNDSRFGMAALAVGIVILLLGGAAAFLLNKQSPELYTHTTPSNQPAVPANATSYSTTHSPSGATSSPHIDVPHNAPSPPLFSKPAPTARLKQAKAISIGTFMDAQTGLMWTSEDNGSDISWAQASDYCKELRLGDYSDWQLPTAKQLQTLYDPSANGRPGIHDSMSYVKEGITLSGYTAWSAKRPSGDVGNVRFTDGESFRVRAELMDELKEPALCVRNAN
mgnify:CR=1 FL=1